MWVKAQTGQRQANTVTLPWKPPGTTGQKRGHGSGSSVIELSEFQSDLTPPPQLPDICDHSKKHLLSEALILNRRQDVQMEMYTSMDTEERGTVL